ncbi:MAG: type IV pilus twitching motility protein PilT [Planctomycetota bacterium]|jgi:twitching motility protein PilT
MNLDELLFALVERRGSDLHLKVGRPPLFRIAGDLLATSFPEVVRQEMQESMLKIMPPPVKRRFEKTLEVDFAYEVAGVGRFRVNSFVQRQEIGAAFRHIPLEVPTVEQMGLPEVFKDIGNHPNGLVIVTGPTGSGKSTTLASIIQHINQTRPVHIITIEDPIEFVYVDELATINQRELGVDTYELMAAMRSALRQDPDVILMGEMRDRDTMEFAITAAETGHLVFSTLHTNDAKQTLDRIIDAFSQSAFSTQIRTQLALTLRAVVCQRLMKRADGTGMVPTIEILVNSPNVQQMLLDSNTQELDKVMQNDTYYGMQSFNQALLKLVKDGVVTEDEALATSSTPEDLKLGLRGVTRRSGGGSIDDDFGSPRRGGKSSNRGGIQRGFEF